MDFDLVPLLAFALAMTLPAAIFVLIFAVLGRRRGKFRRQRITSKGGRHKEVEKEVDKKV